MLLNLRFCQVRGCKNEFMKHECMFFGVRWLPDTKGEYAIATRGEQRGWSNGGVHANGDVGIFQPNPNP